MKGICDTHLHFYDARFPAAPTTVLTPPDALPGDYLSVADELGVERAVIVQPTTYGLDNRCQLEGADSLGIETRAIVVIDSTATAVTIDELHDRGARGVRFHMLPGGALDWDQLEPVAELVAPFGWHVQLQLNGRDLADRHDRLAALPVELVIDHIGRYMPPVDPTHASFEALLNLVESERAWVKLSAPYEAVGEVRAEYPLVDALVGRLVDNAPDRLLWASNWPHPGQFDPPDAAKLLRQRERWIPEPLRQQILVDNPARLYAF